MSNAVTASHIQREPELLGQTVAVIGGEAPASGFETARRARTEGAKAIRAARNFERLKRAASEVDALSTAAFDASDPVAIERFFRDLPMIDHVMVTAGRPYYGRLADMDFAKIRDLIGEHLLLGLYVACGAASKVRPGGALIFKGGAGGRRPAPGMSIAGAGAPLRSQSSPLTWRWKSRRCGSTSSPQDSWIRLCPPNCWAISLKTSQPASHHASHPTRRWAG